VFENRRDVYNSRYILPESVLAYKSNFDEMLKSTLLAFRQEGVKGVFITLSLEKQLDHFTVLRSEGFKFHNASGDEATFVKFLPENKINRLPGFASHYIGIGGLVIDRHNKKVLVIKERSGNDTKGWKIPGGLVDVGETLDQAVVREVREETGIQTKFVGILGLREKINYHFGMNDIYFFCLLELDDKGVIDQCPDEIAKSQWMDIEDFVNAETRVDTQKRIAKLAQKVLELIDAGKDIEEMCWKREDSLTDLETLKALHPIYHSKL